MLIPLSENCPSLQCFASEVAKQRAKSLGGPCYCDLLEFVRVPCAVFLNICKS